MVSPLADDLVRFVQSHLGSVWALRLMLTMQANPQRQWTVDSLKRELRANDLLVARLLERFEQIGLAIKDGADMWQWCPAVPEVDALARAVAEAYAVTPFGVIQAIADSPNDRLRQLADAFRLHRDRDS
jgi:hypothetical protein